MYKIIGANLFFLLFGLLAQGQTTYTVEDLLLLYARNTFNIKNNYAQYQIDSLTQANNQNKYKLQSDFSFSLPFAKSIESIMQPDGSNRLLETNSISPTVQISLRKKMVFLGGDLSFSSSLNGYVDFITGNKQYGSNWFNIQYSQNIFEFNEYKYDVRRIQLQREQDKLTLLYSDLEEITDFVYLIFQYYIDVQALEENNKNIETNQELLKKNRTLLKHGKALASDTLNVYLFLTKLQISNNELESKKMLAENKIRYHAILSGQFEVEVSDVPLMLHLDINKLTERYLKYTLQKDDDLRIFELDSDIVRNRKNRGISVALRLGAGLNSKADDYIYNLFEGRPADKENISLNLTLPMTGWNSQKNKKKIASLNKEIYLREQENNKQEAAFWAQDVIIRYKQALSLIELANKNLEAARELERILIKNIENGKSDYIALYQLYSDNHAVLLEKCNAIRDIYILKYDLIKKTLFDFENESSLINF
ncbi:MAG: TolC family protein [Bacteroidales bacterium]|jgi:outer membrane protein TolC|nr:TolC family protein [Bacteroidales bacterium]